MTASLLTMVPRFSHSREKRGISFFSWSPQAASWGSICLAYSDVCFVGATSFW